MAGVGTTITAKAATTFTQVTSTLTTIIGDAEVNGLIQATRSGDGNDQKAVQRQEILIEQLAKVGIKARFATASVAEAPKDN